jgi:hypothetical protein
MCTLSMGAGGSTVIDLEFEVSLHVARCDDQPRSSQDTHLLQALTLWKRAASSLATVLGGSGVVLNHRGVGAH